MPSTPGVQYRGTKLLILLELDRAILCIQTRDFDPPRCTNMGT